MFLRRRGRAQEFPQDEGVMNPINIRGRTAPEPLTGNHPDIRRWISAGSRSQTIKKNTKLSNTNKTRPGNLADIRRPECRVPGPEDILLG